MPPERLSQLIKLYYSSNMSIEECERLFDYLETELSRQAVEKNELLPQKKEAFLDELRADKVLAAIKADTRFEESRLFQSTDTASIKKVTAWKWLSAAAFIFIVSLAVWLSGTAYDFQTSKSARSNNYTNVNTDSDILPGTKKADVSITKIKSTDYTVVSTPRAAEYQTTLPDGTLVWLNSSSSIQYTTSLNGKIREVFLKGEACFKVAKDAKRPFHVYAEGVLIKALGTQFNVNSYHQGLVKTALIEGSVQVESKDLKSKILRPGEQAVVLNRSIMQVSSTDTLQAIAWKNGFFRFQDEDVKSVMAQVARWYDIEVEFQGVSTGQQFGGVFSRSKKLSELLRAFEAVSSVRFKTEGRRVTVML